MGGDMKATLLLEECHKRGVLLAHRDGKLRVSPPGVLPADLKAELRVHKAEVASLLERNSRNFLPRPEDEENNPNVWEVWTPLMHWLFENYIDAFDAICDSEDALNRLERKGVVSGPQYEAACQKLLTKFEAGRKLKLHHASKIWLQ
jgi:hypothetical protein